jgi:ubiquitin carboxyl-terminal hydrolase 34
MQRNKINDQFDFPSLVDMKPYKIDYLSSPGADTPEDIFELVGVLVHSGTAESGHYYSFIKERNVDVPSSPATWVEFNDADVQYFDPSLIPLYTFGGTEEWRQNGNGQKMYFPKTYSAYMLFYQRIRKQQQDPVSGPVVMTEGPKKTPPPMEMRNNVALDNEMLLRKYCLHDPAHAPFIRSMLDLKGQLTKTGCSESHELEAKAIQLALDHVDQIFAKTKDVPDFDGMMVSISRIVGTCTECCAIAIQWIGHKAEAMRNLLLRCPIAKVRQEFTALVLTAMRYLKMQDPTRYGIQIICTAPVEYIESNGAFQTIVKRLRTLYMHTMETSLKAWDEYFGLLSEMANLGFPEASILLRSHFLTFPLQALVMDASPHLRSDYEKLYKQLLKGRKPSYHKMIELVCTLLKYTDLTLEAVQTDILRSKCRADDRYPLTIAEETVLTMRSGKQRTLVFVSKILDLDQNLGVAKAIVGILCRAEPEFNQLQILQRTLSAGISIDPASQAGPYLQAAIAFCENAPGQREISELIHQTSKDVATIGSAGGREHYLFFRMLYTVQNDRLPSSAIYFRDRLLRYTEFWAPTLLLYWEPEVRLETEELLNDIFFKPGLAQDTENLEQDSLIIRAGQQFGTACLGLLTTKYLDPRSPAPSKTLESMLRVMEKCQVFFECNGDETYDHRRSCTYQGRAIFIANKC